MSGQPSVGPLAVPGNNCQLQIMSLPEYTRTHCIGKFLGNAGLISLLDIPWGILCYLLGFATRRIASCIFTTVLYAVRFTAFCITRTRP